MKTLIRLFILLSCFVNVYCFAKVDVHVEPSEISINENFRITFTYEGQSANFLPDFSSLGKDFTILGTQKRSEVSVLNGVVSAKVQWSLQLNARKPGKYTIAPIAFDGEKSEAFTLDVKKGRIETKAQDKTANIFMHASIDKTRSYVQAGLTYKVKLFYAKRIISGNFSSPDVKNAVLMQLGSTKSYQTTLNGQTYHVAEQDFAVFPEKSGKLVIRSPIFQGVMERDNFSDINQILMDVQRPVKIYAKDTYTQIEPIPGSYTGKTWLPAKNLTLTDAWQGLDKPLKVGEPITRYVRIKAVGLMAEQLPKLSFAHLKNMNVYAQKAKNKNLLQNNNVVGEKTLKLTYIPTTPGPMDLPPLTLTWWDTLNNRQREATLTGTHLSITGALQEKKASQSPPPAKHTVTKEKTKPLAPEGVLASNNRLIPLGLLLVVGLLSVLGVWIYRRQKLTSRAKSSPKSRDFSKDLKAACVENNAKNCAKLLISWAKQHFQNPSIRSLSDIKPCLEDAALLGAIDALEKSLYSKAHDWHGHALWVAWLVERKRNTVKTKKSFRLPPLNPLSRKKG